MNLSDLRVVVLAAACCGLLSGASAEEISGMRELAGESVTWGSLTGVGTLSNGSETLSVVTLTGAEDATFDGTITGNIRLVKTGSIPGGGRAACHVWRRTRGHVGLDSDGGRRGALYTGRGHCQESLLAQASERDADDIPLE